MLEIQNIELIVNSDDKLATIDPANFRVHLNWKFRRNYY